MEVITYLITGIANNMYKIPFLLKIKSCGGAFFSLMTLLFYLAMPNKIKKIISSALSYRHDYIAIILLGITFFSGLIYLAFPNYHDHLESTIASLGLLLLHGTDIFPFPEFYPYHGILYGPLLAIIQSGFLKMSFPVVVASKLPGFFAFSISILTCLLVIKNRTARGYLIALVPFGLYLFWNRAEPFFLLIVCATIYFADRKLFGKHAPIAIGILAGAASALKIHGAFYIFSAFLATTLGSTLSIPSLLLFSMSAIISFLAFFLPSNISLVGFLEYINLAKGHGISIKAWLNNLVYLIFLTIPLFNSWWGNYNNRAIGLKISSIILIEFAVTIVGAKPGAGIHHLLPFIPINAYIIHRLLLDKNQPPRSISKVIFFSLIAPSLITVFHLFIHTSVYSNWANIKKAGEEIQVLDKKYPGLVMGITDDKNYRYTFLRVLLSSEQIDYPSFMDLQYSGVSDHTMAERMNACAIPHFLLRNDGLPFSSNNYYTGSPLLSSKVRKNFYEQYKFSFRGKYFSVYSCHKNLSKLM